MHDERKNKVPVVSGPGRHLVRLVLYLTDVEGVERSGDGIGKERCSGCGQVEGRVGITCTSWQMRTWR